MISVLVPIADGTEELEAVTVIDVLRRAGAEVSIASVMPSKNILASRGVKIEADCLIDACAVQTWDVIVLPGGMPGAEHFQNCKALITLLKSQIAADRWIAAICSAPAVVLGRHDLIGDKNATCYPAFQQELQAKVAHLAHKKVVVDHKLITSQGPGTATEFALTIVNEVFGDDKAAQVAAGMLSNY
ncbi:4-methyl-5(b-hydroxyethyl)-thiazole monophosphate biosynthesis [Alteromonadaceae bacterium Bs31]|nr:4-methyl-5(b-hydroxyethyl)-thiazole monophosphate biosynthesis [Alteromonadaceae bacterium Bs31]